MVGFFETAEAREARVFHNMKSLQTTSDENNDIAFPCPAGVVWVDLSELNKKEHTEESASGGDRPTRRSSSDRFASTGLQQHERRGSLLGKLPEAWHPHGSGFHDFSTSALIARMRSKRPVRRQSSRSDEMTPSARSSSAGQAAGSTSSKKGRRRRRSSGVGFAEGAEADLAGASSQEVGGAGPKGSGSKRGEDLVALDLLQFVIEPKMGAEDAKAAATRSAQIRESYVAQELQVRQMWRVAMGNAPGLKAEIAKLHATERAKLALREFELGERHRRSWNERERRSSGSPQGSPHAQRIRSGSPTPSTSTTRSPSPTSVYPSSGDGNKLGSSIRQDGRSLFSLQGFSWLNGRRAARAGSINGYDSSLVV